MAALKAANTVRAAICHVSPTFLDANATTQTAVKFIQEAARRSANLVVFPESYIPAFPVWSALQAPHQNHRFFHRMVEQSIYAHGDQIQALRKAAKQAGVLVNMGFSEKSPHSTATLYNSNMLIDGDGRICSHHRKLMPTFFEKLTWSPGDGSGLVVPETKFGKIGALICGENTNPLARYSLMTQAEQIHISTWPAIWPTRVQSDDSFNQQGTSMSSNYDNVAANRIRAAAHCFEAKCFGIVSAGYMDEANKDEIANESAQSQIIRKQLDAAPQAASMFLDPTGALLPAFTFDEQTGETKTKDFLQHEPGILYADLDLSKCIEGKQYHDVTGGYQRLDVFELKVDRRRREPATFIDDNSVD